jgi:hypothetical protein
MVAAMREATFNMDHGLVRVVAQLFFGDQSEQCAARGRLAPAARAFDRAGDRRLGQCVRPRILVDKSPSIVYRIETMQRVYAMFHRRGSSSRPASARAANP